MSDDDYEFTASAVCVVQNGETAESGKLKFLKPELWTSIAHRDIQVSLGQAVPAAPMTGGPYQRPPDVSVHPEIQHVRCEAGSGTDDTSFVPAKVSSLLF